jgi:hypothetical protein
MFPEFLMTGTIPDGSYFLPKKQFNIIKKQYTMCRISDGTKSPPDRMGRHAKK